MTQISVIIPLLKWTDYFPQAVKSVLESAPDVPSSHDVDCVVVAGDSDLKERVREYCNSTRVQLLRHDAKSIADACNVGIEACKGDFIARLSPTNILMKDWENSVKLAAAGSPRTDLLFGAGFEVDENGVPHKPRHPRYPNLHNLKSRLSIVPDAVFYHRSLFHKFGPFDPTIALRSEFEFLLRLASAKVSSAEIKSALVGLRVTSNRRRATPEELEMMIAETTESIEILRSKGIHPGDRWLLYRGALEADQAGLTRLSSVEFDRHVLRSALSQRLSDIGTSTQKITATVNMALCHASIESNFLLKRPRLAKRFIPKISFKRKGDEQEQTNEAGEAREDRPSRRIFQLRYDTPYPCRLESAYFEPPEFPSSLSISIVTPNLNQGEFIERTIKSVLGQCYPRLEYIVQDGCSRDQSVEIIQRYESHLSNWQSVKDRGQSHAINMGLERTTGDIMAYLNSDDIILPGSLAYVASYFERNPQIDVVYGDRLLIDEQDRVINHWVLPSHDAEAIAWADYIPQETMFWRRSAWEAIGGCVDDTFHFAMDWDMILRFRSHGKRFAHLPRFLGAFRITDGQKTKQLLASVGMKEMSRLRKRELGYVPSEIEVSRRMVPYVKRQWYAEQRFNLSRSMAMALGNLHAWEPNQYNILSDQLERAA